MSLAASTRNLIRVMVVRSLCVSIPCPWPISQLSPCPPSLDEKWSLCGPSRGIWKAEKCALFIHGGADTILCGRSSPKQQARYHAELCAALQAGTAILSMNRCCHRGVSIMEGKQYQSHRTKQVRSVLDVPLLYLQIIRFSMPARVPYLTWLTPCVFFHLL